jgi:O-antigen/teichoic acid export membrane protein
LRPLGLGKASTGVASNGVGLAVSILIQVVSVPAYLGGFGATVYGDWLVLSAIPMYLSLGDLGLASVSSTHATRQFAVGQVAHARRTMRSSWLAVTLLSVVILPVALALLWLLPFAHVPVQAIPSGSARSILLLLVGYTLVTLQSSFVEGCFRAGGRFPVGIMLANSVRLAEFLAAALTALWSHSPVAAAGVLLVARILGHVFYLLALRRVVPELTLGYRAARLADARELVMPGLAFLAFPVGNALAVQGMVVTTAVELGPTAVVTLNALRILANLLRQIASVIDNGVLPEMTAALAREDRDGARRLMNLSLVTTLLIGGLCAVTLAAAGDTILDIWTDGEIQAPVTLMVAMSMTVIADLPWLSWSLPLIARNQHHLLGILYAGSCLLAVVATKLLLSRLGLVAVPLALFLTDVVLYVPAWRGASRILDRAVPIAGSDR